MARKLGYILLTLNLLLPILLGSKPSAMGNGVKTVVIDAGHGGKDPGNLGTGRYKTREKDIALAVALKVGQYISQNFSDVRVIYTRSTDVFVELEERAKIANRAGADLFISIHCDAFTKSSVMGSTTIVMGKDHDDDNLRIAQKENSVIFMEDNYEERYEGFDPSKPESYIALTLYQNAFMQQSISFAQKVQDQFRERVQRRDRGVKQQPLMVTKMAVMPSVLIELGFLTNPAEEDFLNSAQGQDYMASAIYRAFKDYKVERESILLELSSGDKAQAETSTPKTETSTPKVQEPKEEKPTQAESIKTYYAVQIATSARKYELKPENFKGLKEVSYYESDGFYKYTVGQLLNLEEAEALKLDIRRLGYKDAFVVALSDGKRISLEDAKDMLP